MPFEAAAMALETDTAWADLPHPVRALLETFRPAREDAALLRLAARVGPLFRLAAPQAPGLAALGAEVDLAAAAGEPPGALPPASASGVGETPLAALRACLGEAAELLASVETPGDRARMRSFPPPGAAADPALARLLAALPWPEGRMETLWLPARRLTDGAEVWIPREIALRGPPGRRAFPPPWPLSLGCGAGRTPEDAALRGLLELVERDAVALWWRGGRRARAIALEDPAQARAAALLARLRQDRAGARRSWLLDITTDLGVPVVAAVSFAPDGSGFCCGTAARPGGRAPAAEAAVLELAQMELAQALVEAKARARGEAALNARDRAHRRRHDGVHAARCALVHPALPPVPPDDGAARPGEDAPAAMALDALVRRLAAHGLAPLRLDLTRGEGGGGGVGVPVARMICPGLETESTAAPGPRLSAAIAETGGGETWASGIALT